MWQAYSRLKSSDHPIHAEHYRLAVFETQEQALRYGYIILARNLQSSRSCGAIKVFIIGVKKINTPKSPIHLDVTKPF